MTNKYRSGMLAIAACSLGATLSAMAGNREISFGTPVPAPMEQTARIEFLGSVEGGGISGTACALGGANCQAADGLNAFNSTTGGFRVADDFDPAASGNITQVCWTGVYANAGVDCGGTAVDAFTIVIYNDNNGLPGTVAGTYVQGTTAAVTRAATGVTLPFGAGLAQYEYSAILSGTLVNAVATNCYWLEITNGVTGCTWFWETGTGGATPYSVQDGNNAYTLADVNSTDFSFCLNLALDDSSVGPCLPNVPANDLCANAAVLATNGTVATVDLRSATDSGTDPQFSCKFGGAGNGSGSVWYRFTATATSHRITTCDSPGVDSIIAVYSGTCATLTEIACNDDLCGTLSELCVTGLTPGTQYFIQLAAFDAASRGVYSIAVGPCLSCQEHLPAGGYIIVPSDVAIVTGWDDFQVADTANMTTIQTTGIYWNGVNGAGANVTIPPANQDLFNVSIFRQGTNGLPDTLVATRSVLNGDLTVVSRTPQGIGFDFNGPTPGGFAEFQEHVLSFTPIAMTPGCYWFTVSNDLPTQPVIWWWLGGRRSVMTAGNDRAAFDNENNGVQADDQILGDMIWCMDLNLLDPLGCTNTTPPTNDNCATATVVPCNPAGVTLALDLRNATENGADPIPSCTGVPALGTVWFTVTTGNAPASLLIETCTTVNVGVNDSVLAVYTAGPGGCGELTEVACANDNCAVQYEEILIRPALPNTTYYIMLGGVNEFAQLFYNLRVTCPAPPAPANDLCADAVSVAVGGTVNGTTLNSTLDQNAVDAGDCNGVTVGAKGVWYKVVGNGSTLQASMCNSLDPFDSQISVFCGPCENLVCVNADDDGCGAPGSGTVSQTSWCSENGREYLVLVHNFPGDLGGDFTLDIVDIGPACTPTVVCPSTGCPGQRGDTNCDGGIDFFDIDPFLLALFNPAQYASTFCGGSICAADIDCSGQVDFFDIDPFLACLFTACPPCP